MLFNLQYYEEEERIRYKLLIVPGYIIGLNCLFLMTYRTLIAFFSESKSFIVNINKFGEQFIDLFALVIIWVISLIGLIILFWMLKEEKVLKNSFYKYDKRPIIDQNQSFFNIGNNTVVKDDEMEIKGVLVEPVKNIDEKINLEE